MRTIDKVLQLAQAKGVNQSGIAKVAGVAPSRVSEWKNNDGKPTLEHSLRLSRFLEVPLEYLADEGMDSPSLPEPLGEAERLAVEMVQALGLTKADVIRKLSNGLVLPPNQEGCDS